MRIQSGPGEVAGLSFWAWATIVVVTALALRADLVRLRDPSGEKYVSVMAPGGADFVITYLGARALVRGLDPYDNDAPDLRDPWGREYPVGGRMVSQFYPATHLLIYVPLVWLTGGDARMASRLWFDLNCVFIVALAWVTYSLLSVVHGGNEDRGAKRLPRMVLIFLVVALALNSGTELGLERGQSDILTALACWGAVLLSIGGMAGWAMFLAVGATLLKGYGVLFAPGLGLLFLGRRHLFRAVVGSLAAVAVLLLPVIRYVPEGIALARGRVGWFAPYFINHSFRNFAFQIAGPWAVAGQRALGLLGLAAVALCWALARRAFRSGGSSERAASLTLFTVTALGTVTGYSPLSYSYNLSLVLPGALLLGLAQQDLLVSVGLVRSSALVLGISLVLINAFLFSIRLGWGTFPGAALGLVGLILLCGISAAAALRSGVLRASSAPAAP